MWITLIQYDVCLWRELGHNNCCFKILSVVSPQLWRFLFCFCISSIKFNSLELKLVSPPPTLILFKGWTKSTPSTERLRSGWPPMTCKFLDRLELLSKSKTFFIIILWKYLSSNTFATTCLKQNMNFFLKQSCIELNHKV